MIEIDRLSYTYSDGRFGLQDISLVIPDGQLVVIAGANGSGKTTLLRHMNGLLLPQKGTIIIDEMNIAKNLRKVRQLVGMVFQDSDNQIIGETVFRDIAFGPENLAWPQHVITSAVNEALEQVNLSHLANKSPHLLSGGEKKRLTIAGVMVMQPRIYLFDEPFANLDFPGIRSVLTQIISLHQKGHTIIITAHDVEKIAFHAQRLLILQQGRIVRDGLFEELMPVLEVFNIRRPCLSKVGLPVDSWLN